MENKTMEMIVGKSVEISAETSEAIKKLPKSVRAIAQSITEAESKLKAKAETAVSSIQSEAYTLEKVRAGQLAIMVKTYDMKDEDAPFKSWGEFAKEAWNRSPAWLSIQRRVGAAFINASESEATARAIAKDFSVSQMQEMLPLVDKKTDKILPLLETMIANGEITPDMTCTGDGSIREAIEKYETKKEQKESKIDLYIPETGDTIPDCLLSEMIPLNDENYIKVNFKPESADKNGVPWKGIVCIDKKTMLAKSYLYHAHKVGSTELAANNETMKVVLALRALPEQFRKDIMASYKNDSKIDFEKLCFHMGFKVEDFS